MKSRFLFILGVMVIGFALAGYGWQIKHKSCVMRIGPACLTAVEKAVTADQQATGLGNRASLANYAGMLFPFNPPQKPSFWMKGMQFPLDFIWILDGKVVELTEHVAAPGQGLQNIQLLTYVPKEDVDNVLEVNAGFVEYYKIKVGDEIKEL